MERNHFSLSRLRRGSSCLTPSRPVHPHFSLLAAPCYALSRSTRSCPFLQVSARFCIVLSLSSPTLPRPAAPFPRLATPCLVHPGAAVLLAPCLPRPVLLCPVLPGPALSCSTLPGPVQSCPSLPCPVLHWPPRPGRHSCHRYCAAGILDASGGRRTGVSRLRLETGQMCRVLVQLQAIWFRLTGKSGLHRTTLQGPGKCSQCRDCPGEVGGDRSCHLSSLER